MKALFIATSALAILATQAQAIPLSLETYGGATVQGEFSGEGLGISFSQDHQTGYVLGFSAGVPVLVPGLQAELDISWRHSALQGLLESCGTQDLSGGDSTFAALANLRYSKAVGPVTLYALAGAGYASRRLDFDPSPINFTYGGGGAEEQGFAWQLGAGAQYPVSENLSLGLGYRYFMKPSIDRVAVYDWKTAFFESNQDEHDFILSATWQIN